MNSQSIYIFAFKQSRLTLTRVVFELLTDFTITLMLPRLTLTRVVFEWIYVLDCAAGVRITLTRVVFEFFNVTFIYNCYIKKLYTKNTRCYNGRCNRY